MQCPAPAFVLSTETQAQLERSARWPAACAHHRTSHQLWIFALDSNLHTFLLSCHARVSSCKTVFNLFSPFGSFSLLEGGPQFCFMNGGHMTGLVCGVAPSSAGRPEWLCQGL